MKHIWHIANVAVAMFTIAAITTTPALANQQPKERRYAAPDGGLWVFVTAVSEAAGHSEGESKIEFKSTDGNIACFLDYSSSDSDHGFRVAKAEWTPDSQYFVFSLTSSGGHQSWHFPTQFLSRKDGTIRSLDDYFAAAGISKADFQVTRPTPLKPKSGKASPSPFP